MTLLLWVLNLSDLEVNYYRQITSVCLTILWGWPLKGLDLSYF